MIFDLRPDSDFIFGKCKNVKLQPLKIEQYAIKASSSSTLLDHDVHEDQWDCQIER